jgi:hypothetical protein
MAEELKELKIDQVKEALQAMHKGLIGMQARLDDHEKVLEQLITGMNNLAEAFAPQKGFRQQSNKTK